MKTERRTKRIIVCLFLLMFVVGAVIGMDYVMSTDEDSEYRILWSNISEYSYRLLGEDHPITQRLEQRAKRISTSVERDHGISAYYPFFPLGVLLGSISRYALLQGWHLYTFAIFMMGVAALYGIAMELWHSRRVALAAALMLYLTPRMFAEGHYNNKDVVLMALFLMDMRFGIRWIKNNRLRDAVLFSLIGAVAANTKILGAWCWGCLGLTYLVTRVARREMNARTWRHGLFAVALFAAGYCALTPAMWSDPVGYFQYLIENAARFSRWEYAVLFEGKIYSMGNGDALPWYYLPKLIAMTTPIYILLLTAVGTVATAARLPRKTRRQEDILTAVIGIIGLVPMVYAMCSRMVLYNGWRHFSFFYATVIVLAARGFEWLWRVARWKKALCGAMAVVMCGFGVLIALNHPLEGSYYNAIAAPYVDGNYETDYWCMSHGAAADRLLKYSDKDVMRVAFNNLGGCYNGRVSMQANPAYSGRMAYASNDSTADYVIVVNMYAQVENRLSDEALGALLEKMTAAYGAVDELDMVAWECDDEFRQAFAVKAWGIPIATVYERVDEGV